MLSILFLVACSNDGGSGGSSAKSIQGLDLSGAWRLTGITCYDSSFQSVTARGATSSASSSSTITISGNTATSSAIGATSCQVGLSRSFVATLSSGSISGGYGTLALGSSSATTSTGGSCSVTLDFTMTTGSLVSSSVVSTYSNGQAITSQNTEFIVAGSSFSIPSIFQVSSRPTDVCLFDYTKL